MEFLAVYAGVMLIFAFVIGGTLGDGCGSIVAAWLGLMLLGVVFAGAR